MTARRDVLGWKGAAVNHGKMKLAKGDPELNEDRHKFQNVNMLLWLINDWLGVIVGIVPPQARRETTLLEIRSGKAPHVVQMVKRGPASHRAQGSVCENVESW
jgi:hypothetical protein